jgi:hypothetical protein
MSNGLHFSARLKGVGDTLLHTDAIRAAVGVFPQSASLNCMSHIEDAPDGRNQRLRLRIVSPPNSGREALPEIRQRTSPPPSDMLILKTELGAKSGVQGWSDFGRPVNQSAVAVKVCAEPAAASAS